MLIAAKKLVCIFNCLHIVIQLCREKNCRRMPTDVSILANRFPDFNFTLKNWQSGKYQGEGKFAILDRVRKGFDMTKVARLLDAVVPSKYRMKFDINMDEFTFRVHEELDFELSRASNEITLHAVGLDITKVGLDADGTVKMNHLTENKKDQSVTMQFADQIKSGKHTLEIDFNGRIEEVLHGLYRSNYIHDGKQKALVVTDLEPVSGREVFVGVDEPAAKAVFELTLVVPKNLTALSNTNAVSEKVTGETKEIRFATTPKMSSYLFAFCVGEFDHIEGKTTEGVKVGVYGVPGQGNQLQFALDTAIDTLAFYNDYFGIPYPLPKLDMIALPDFAVGAMENWGMITYRDTALLLDPEKTGLMHRQRVAEVITHELAHQWFGNLVTMAWWDDLWLNEGFASWVEVLAKDHLFPQWQSWTEFVAGDLAYALETNSLASSPPLQLDLEDPRELETLIDPTLVYSKGPSIIRMLDAYLGRETFRDGLRVYLKRHAYGNAVTTDLWKALAEVSGKPVEEVMNAWTGKAGYPILSFENGQVSQQRFFSSPREASRAKASEPWPVPLSYLLPDGTVTEQTLVTKTAEPMPNEVAGAKWFKPNAGQTGLFRTRYSMEMTHSLEQPLREGKLDEIDRFGLVDDIVAGAEAGLTDAGAVLNLVASLRDEPAYTVWSAVSGGLGSVEGIVEEENLRDRLDTFGQWLVQPNVKRLGWAPKAGESVFDTLMRPMVLSQAVRFDDEAVTAEARRQFEMYLAGEPVDPDLRPVALYAAARHGGQKEYDALVERYRQEESPQLRTSLLGTLGRFRKGDLIDQYLKMALSKDVRPQDIYIPLAWSFRNRDARDKAWTWVQQNWDEFVRRYGEGGKMLDRFPHYAASAFATHDKAKEIKDFFEGHPHPSTSRATPQAVESLELKADWADRDLDKIKKFVSEWEASR
jgi:puromycin-sensitive aminopeptidase